MCWRMCGGFQDMGTTAYSFSVFLCGRNIYLHPHLTSPQTGLGDAPMELPAEGTCHL